MADESSILPQCIMRCPFLRNINEPINFSSSSLPSSLRAQVKKGPIFEDGPSFDTVFGLFHGPNGVVPLSNGSFQKAKAEPEHVFDHIPSPAGLAKAIKSLGFNEEHELFKKPQKYVSSQVQGTKTPMLEDDVDFVKAYGFSLQYLPMAKAEPVSHQFNPLAAATISLSTSAVLPIGFDDVFNKYFYQSGFSAIAKSYRTVSNALPPIVAKTFKPSSTINFNRPPSIMVPRAVADIKHKCTPAVMTAGWTAAAAFSKKLMHQPMLTEMLLIGVMAMVGNVPLGMWREHTRRFSPSWFAAVLPTIPFLAILCSSVLMPKTTMVVAIAAAVLGQVVGSMAELYRLEAIAAKPEACVGGGSNSTRNMTELAFHIVISVFNCFVMLDFSLKKTPMDSSSI